VPYPSSDKITGIMALSIAFTVLYMIGIPSYLFYLIRKAVGEVDRNLGTERLYDEIKEVKTKQAEGWQQVAKQLEDDAQKKYQEAVNAYQQAASTLYSSYERKYRYYKIIVLLEKLILIMVILPLWRHMTDSMLQNVQSFSPPLDAFFSSH
jgi:tryptophan 2,3-dioxygenase